MLLFHIILAPRWTVCYYTVINEFLGQMIYKGFDLMTQMITHPYLKKTVFNIIYYNWFFELHFRNTLNDVEQMYFGSWPPKFRMFSPSFAIFTCLYTELLLITNLLSRYCPTAKTSPFFKKMVSLKPKAFLFYIHISKKQVFWFQRFLQCIAALCTADLSSVNV